MNRTDQRDTGTFPPETRERAFLVGIETGKTRRWEVEDHLEELARLANTAGADVVGSFIQKCARLNPAYYMGRGKAEELKGYCVRESVKVVIFDDDLSAVQIKNLQDLTGIRVIDRTELILDIFAQHAISREGKVQVELAQLRYMLPRLTRAWTHLSRQEGGIGTRGPGEKQLEVDRRRIRERIQRLSDTLKGIEKERATQRRKRERQKIPTIALVGYTNAGKSTLMNALTDAGVTVEDRLFATLDTTTRVLTLPAGRKALLIDTVGFIRKLPHHLIESFKATLEGVVNADLLLHVIDISHEQVEAQMDGVWTVLKNLDVTQKPIIAVFNKIDLLGDDRQRLKRFEQRIPHCVAVSSTEKAGLTDLLAGIETELSRRARRYRLAVPHKRGALLAKIHEQGQVFSRRYEEQNVVLEAEVPPSLVPEIERYVIERAPE
jgi:GTP-binding protein HflX